MLKWAIIALVALGLGATFFVDCDEEAAAPKGGPRVAAVATAAVGAELVTERVAYPGELDADAADVAAVFAGRLDAMHVRIGDVVERGAPLAVVSIVDLAELKADAAAQIRAAKAVIQRNKADLDLAQREAARFAKLVEGSLVSSSEADVVRSRARALGAEQQGALAALAQAEAQLALLTRREEESTIRAPFAGRVVDRYVDAGGFVTVGLRLVRLVATGDLRVRFEVPEQDIAYAKVGGAVDVAVPALGPETASATISGIGAEVQRDRRVVIVEGVVSKAPATWVAGMYTSAFVVHHSIEGGPVVPEAALLSRVDDAGKTVVGVFVNVDKVARWVPVEVRARARGRVAVSGDVKVGAEVLIEGHQDLSDGATIRATRRAPDLAAPSAERAPDLAAPSAERAPDLAAPSAERAERAPEKEASP